MLYDRLKKYTSGNTCPMHMPGHKRNPVYMPDSLTFDIDITEIQGFDDLHDMQGVLLETSKLAARLYGSRQAYIITTGSTTGILAAIGAHAGQRGKILADSSCHQSVSNAAELFGLELAYIPVRTDESSGVPCGTAPAAVEEALFENTGTRLVIITSPNYEGIVSDIRTIADITHKSGALLFVDAAHGAHLGFSDYFPKSPITLGADIAVISLHKTMPALTQCSLLHICSELASTSATRQMLDILQTSSPSYILMASIDHCLRLLEFDAAGLFYDYKNNLERFYSLTSGLTNISILTRRAGFFAHDPGKIVVITKNASITGFDLIETLRIKYDIELERACKNYAIAMTSICDTRESFKRLATALIEIDEGL